MRRLTFLLLAAASLLTTPASAQAVDLPGPVVALAAGPGSVYAVVGTTSRNVPFRLTRGSRPLATFGSRGAEYADVAVGPDGPVTVFARPTSTGFAYEAGLARLGEGTGPPVLTLDGAAPVVAFPDDDGDVVLGGSPLTQTGPLLRHAPLDVTDGPAHPRPRPVARAHRAPGPRPRRARRPRRLRRRPAPHRGDDRARRPPPLRRLPSREPAHARLGARNAPGPLVAPAPPHPRPAQRHPRDRPHRPPHRGRHEPARERHIRHLHHHRRAGGHVPRSPHQPARVRPRAARRDRPRRSRLRRLDPPAEGACAAHRQASARGLRPVVRSRT